MIGFLIAFFSILSVGIGIFAILLVLMQRSSEGGGFGSSLGGSAVESIFGGGAGDVLSRVTVKVIAAFFTVALILSMLTVHRAGVKNRLPDAHLPSVQVVEKNLEIDP
jgi:protein translocase SecG subunit